MVACPFKSCNYRTNCYSAFNAHKSRNHRGHSDFGDCVVLADNNSAPVVIAEEPADSHSACSADSFALDEVNSHCDTEILRTHLNHNLASLFLKMKSILHVSGNSSAFDSDIFFVPANTQT